MKIIGQYNSENKYLRFHTPLKVTESEGVLKSERGFVVAVRGQYGDWVSPTLVHLGIKSRFKVDIFT